MIDRQVCLVKVRFMKKLQCVKGMHDILPEQMPKWHFVESTYRRLVELFGYTEIRTPMVEPQALFLRGIGDDTDIVEKEMYAFSDKGGVDLALRPEGTASTIRSFLQHNLGEKSPVTKVYYLGPMFRRERPAKGRYRQFYQAGAELIGVEEPTADAEIIDMAVQYVESLGINDVQVQLNSLGDADTRPKYREALIAYFSKSKEQLCGDCKRRLDTNPLRVLDCKVSQCIELGKNAPSVLDFLNDDAALHFSQLREILDRHQICYTVEPKMVRGLDYYTRTIFEIQGKAEALGAQATIVGGGRYNGLVEKLGGRKTPTIGFAFGIERLILMLNEDDIAKPKQIMYVAGVGKNGSQRAWEISRKLRQLGVKIEVAYKDGSLRSQLKRANKFDARIAIIAGESEAQRGAVTFRNMEDGTQEEVLVEKLKEKIEELKL